MIGVAGIMAENIVQSKRLFDHTQATRHASAEPHNRSRYDDDGGSVVFFANSMPVLGNGGVGKPCAVVTWNGRLFNYHIKFSYQSNSYIDLAQTPGGAMLRASARNGKNWRVA